MHQNSRWRDPWDNKAYQQLLGWVVFFLSRGRNGWEIIPYEVTDPGTKQIAKNIIGLTGM